jgi:hypothetical protein
MAELTLNLIPFEHVEAVWPLAEDNIKKAVDQGDGLVTLQSHQDHVFEGLRQLWLVWDERSKECVAVFVTEIINDRFFMWVCGGGRMKEWLHLAQDGLERWARDRGCKGMQLWGRPGWSRVLSTIGYKKTLIAMNKEF